MKTPDQLSAEKTMLLHMPHNIMLVDQIIDIKAQAFSSTITLGYNNPADQTQTAVTLQMPTSFLKILSDSITDKLKENSQSIKDQHKIFADSL